MTFLLITFATLGILAFLAALTWLGRRLAFRPPLEDARPASWLAREGGRE